MTIANKPTRLNPDDIKGIFDEVDESLFLRYRVDCQFVDKVMGGTPQKADLIAGWIRARAGVDEDAELAAMVRRTLSEIGVDTPEEATYEEIVAISEKVAADRHGNTFKRDDKGLFLETRQIKSGLKEATAVLFSGERWGKALALDTPIPTPTGWTTMGELAVGDQVLGADGQPTTVTFATEVQLNRVCYRISFSDGTSIIADADHRWLAWSYAARRNAARGLTGWGPQVVTTAEMLASVQAREGFTNWSIACAAPVQLPEATLPVDPYTFGAWLGDGSSAGASIVVAGEKSEILENIEAAGYAISPQKPREDRVPMYGIGVKAAVVDSATGRLLPNHSLYTTLREMGQINNKHVPQQYLRASVEQRLAFLQGLMDTDGSVEPNGRCEFSNTRVQLAEAVYDLAAGLGWKPTVLVREASEHAKTAYRVRFYPDRPVFRIGRKLARLTEALERETTRARATETHRFIESIEPVESAPVRCIEVDAPDHLFLAGKAYIPTHNTKKGPKNALSEWVFVEGQRVHLGRTEPDGTWTQHGVVSGPSGSRSTLTQYDYCEQPAISFVIKSLIDPQTGNERIERQQWKQLLAYLQYSGLGALRSQSHGQFKVTAFELL